METPWGEISVADAHIHFFSHRFFSLLHEQSPALEGRPVEEVVASLGWVSPHQDAGDFAGRWVAELDRQGVAQAVLIASLPGDEESVATAVRRFPDRFWGYFFLNPASPDALQRLERAAEAGLRCACLFPAMHGYSLSSPHVESTLSFCRDRNLKVFLHCGVLSVGIRKKLGLPSPFDLRFSNPIDVHPLALRFPEVSFTIPHFGAGFFREALMVAGLCPNVFFDTSSSNDWMRYHAGPLDLAEVFRRALDVAGPQRLLFGTDSSFFPRGWNRAVFDAQVAALQSIRVPSADAQAIFGGNLRRLLA